MSGPQAVYRFLKQIRDRPDVQEVYVLVTDYPGVGYWPSSDTIIVVTSATADEVFGWFPEEYQPDEISEELPYYCLMDPLPVPAGMKAVTMWYD
jgi:hypothetical protein